MNISTMYCSQKCLFIQTQWVSIKRTKQDMKTLLSSSNKTIVSPLLILNYIVRYDLSFHHLIVSNRFQHKVLMITLRNTLEDQYLCFLEHDKVLLNERPLSGQ